MADVFISYAREDREFVERLCDALRLNNRDIWFDLEGLLPSAEWRQEIFSAIEGAQAIIQVITPHFAASEGCAEELAHAIKNNKRIVPVICQDVNEKQLPDAIKERHWIYIREADDFDAGVASLTKTLDTNIEWVRSHTRLLTLAKEWGKHNRDYSYALHGSDLRKAEAALTTGDRFEPTLLPLQIDYILASRRTANRRVTFAIGLAAVALVGLVFLGALFFLKRQESTLNLAANFREMGISELEDSNPLAAEVFFARALSISDNVGARERLIEARAESPRLLWIGAPAAESNSVLTVSGDGVLFVVASPSEVSIWDVRKRIKTRVYGTRMEVQERPVAVFGPAHRLLAVSVGNKINLWDLHSTSEQPIETVATHTDVSSLSISSDGSLLIVGEGDGTISQWSIDERSNSPLLKLYGHTDRITGTIVSADNKTLISSSWDETAKVWDLHTGINSGTFTGHDDALLCVAISPDGKVVASAGWDDTIWIWDRETGKGIRALTGHTGSILSLAFSTDGKWLVSGSEDRTARLWEVKSGRHLLTFPGHSGDVTSVAFVESGEKELVTGDASGVVRLWDVSMIGQRQELTTLRGHDAGVTMIAFDPTAPLLSSSSVDGTVDVWNLLTGGLVKPFRNQSGSVSAVAFSPDGKYLAWATKSSAIWLWEIATGETSVIRDEDAAEKIRHIVFSADSSQLAAGCEDGKIEIWNVSAKSIEHYFAAHNAKIQGLEFSPDGTTLASSSEDSTIKLWNVSDWKLKNTLVGHQSGVYEIAFSPDGRLLLSGSDDKTARLWDVASGKEVIKPIVHDGPVWAVDFDRDGELFATGSEDSTVQLWKLSTSGTTTTLRDHFVFHISDGPIWWLKFHDSSSEINLGIASQDKTVRVFHMSKLAPLFLNPATLEREAEEQGGLVIGQGPTGEPQIVPMAPEIFAKKQLNVTSGKEPAP